jgi:orotidine-5'-phosphate decarboxylase
MYVVGATRAEMLSDIRKIIPNHFLLVPGIGAQGGSLTEVARHGLNSQCGLLVNSSRQIIYAGKEADFAQKARVAANTVRDEMAVLLKEKGII